MRRRPGEGTIRKRSDGRWEARVTIGFDRRGRQVQRSVYGRTQTEVVARRREIQEQVGAIVDDETITVAAFARRWLAFKARGPRAVKRSTLATYSRQVEDYVLPHLGRYQVRRVRPLHVDSMMQALAAQGLGARTIASARRVLAGMFRQALRWEIIRSNPVDAVAPPDTRPGRGRSEPLWTAFHVATFLDRALEHRLGALFYLALTTGLRQGELLALRPADVDLEAGTVEMSRTLSVIPGEGLVFTTPKTHRSARTVRLGEDAVVVLREHLVRRRKMRSDAGELWKESGLLFPSTVGTPVSPRNLVRAFKHLAAAAGVPEVRFHDLRHIYASLALREGLQLGELSERLGHFDPAFTLSVYTHVLEDSSGGALTLAQLTAGTKKDDEKASEPAGEPVN